MKRELENKEENKDQSQSFERILIICPSCKSQKWINVPLKVIIESRSLLTIGIPTGLICNHSFQAFVDRNSNVRGYHVIDFMIHKTEYFQSQVENDNQNPFTKSPFFQDLIILLRNSVDDREILGSALLSTKGNVLYSSIPNNTLIDTIREFEVRSKEKLHSILKIFLELKNHQKVCSEYLKIHDLEVILVLIFSEMVNFGIGNMYLKDIVKKVEELK